MSCRICCFAARTARSAGTICARCSTGCGTRREPVVSGATFRMSTARGGAVYQQMRRWLDAGVFEVLVGDVQAIAREWAGRKGQPTAVCIDSRTLQSTPESGARAGYDGAKRRKGSKVHIAVDTLGHLLALKVTPADQGDREQVAALAEEIQLVTGSTVELAYVDQGYTGPNAAQAASEHGIRLEVVKHPLAKRGFVLLPRRWVVERSFAWAARFRRLARDYERLDSTLKGFHYIAFAILMTTRLVLAACQSS